MRGTGRLNQVTGPDTVCGPTVACQSKELSIANGTARGPHLSSYIRRRSDLSHLANHHDNAPAIRLPEPVRYRRFPAVH